MATDTLRAIETGWQNLATGAVVTVTEDTPAPLFAGHTPGTVEWGMNAPLTQWRPTHDEARTMIGGDFYVDRHFTSGEVTESWLNERLAMTDATGCYGVMSCKVANQWDQVVNGSKDYLLDRVKNVALARKAQGKRPFAFTIHHEPDGDGPGSNRISNLTIWGQMQEYCSNYLAPYNDAVVWCCIANGHWFGAFPKPDRIAAALPDSLYSTFAANKGIVMADFYDPNPPNNNRDNPGGWSGLGAQNMAHDQIAEFINYAKTGGRPKVALGCGEFGSVRDEHMQEVFDVTMAHRDVWAISLYFNNFANSRWDWRLIPDDYPAYNGTSGELTDTGGSVMSELLLEKFRECRNLSRTPIYTTPV